MKSTQGNQYPEETHAIFLSNVDGSGDDVMAFTSLSLDVFARAFTGRITWDEIYEVPDQDVSTYIYEPFWPTKEQEAHALKLAGQSNPPTPATV